MHHHFLPPPFRRHHDHTHPRRRPVLLYCLGISVPLCLLAVGMAMSQPNEIPDTPLVDKQTWTDTLPETLPATVAPLPEDATAEDLRAYYDTLVQQLNQMLLNERTDRFVMEYAYEQEVDKLKASVAYLEKQLEAIGTVPETKPSQGSDSFRDPSTETEPETPSETGTETEAMLTPTEDYTYDILDDGVIIRAYTGSSRHVKVPAEMDGRPVVALGDNTFKNTDVISVTLPDTITSVGWFAFYECQSLKTVVIPASVIRIDYAAFDGCPTVTLVCPADSYAARYAAAFGIPYEET